MSERLKETGRLLLPWSNFPETMNLTIVLPCYNEEQNIAASVRDVDQWLQSAGYDAEIVVVDDGSTDRSAAVLAELQQALPRLKVIHNYQNGGYGIAVRAGCDHGDSEWVAFMDSDGQFHAKDFDNLVPHTKDYDFVTGCRINRADPLLRNLFGKLLGTMNFAMLGLRVRDVNCGMKMFRRAIWRDIRPLYGVEKLFNTEIFLNLKRRNIAWATVDVPHYPRKAGKQTGGSVRVILRMFKELWNLKRSHAGDHHSAELGTETAVSHVGEA